MAPALAASLRDELSERGLYDHACSGERPDGELAGGEAEAVAVEHFARRFTTSSARVSFVVLGPDKNTEPTSTDLRAFFQDGRVAVLDLACGSGGGLFGMLCTLAELRRQGVQSRLPLEVHVLAADISATARAIHGAMLERVRGQLAEVGVRVTCEYMEWNAKEDYSTTRLMDVWFASTLNCEAFLVFVSAFGNFAQDNQEVVRTAIRDVLVRFHDNRQVLVTWIEPVMKGNKKWFESVVSLIRRLFLGRGRSTGGGPGISFRWRHPFTAASIPGSAQILSCDRLDR